MKLNTFIFPGALSCDCWMWKQKEREFPGVSMSCLLPRWALKESPGSHQSASTFHNSWQRDSTRCSRWLCLRLSTPSSHCLGCGVWCSRALCSSSSLCVTGGYWGAEEPIWMYWIKISDISCTRFYKLPCMLLHLCNLTIWHRLHPVDKQNTTFQLWENTDSHRTTGGERGPSRQTTGSHSLVYLICSSFYIAVGTLSVDILYQM